MVNPFNHIHMSFIAYQLQFAGLIKGSLYQMTIRFLITNFEQMMKTMYNIISVKILQRIQQQ